MSKKHGKDGFIDLLWKGTHLIEHKSKGKKLGHADVLSGKNICEWRIQVMQERRGSVFHHLER